MKFSSFLVFILIFCVYIRTVSPYLQAGDSAEMAAASISLGIPHQPSYPLYVLTSHLITKLPIPYFSGYFSSLITKDSIKQKKESKDILIYRTGVASALFQSLASLYLFLSLIQFGKIINPEESDNKKDRIFLFLSFALVCIYSFSQTIWLYASKPEVFALNNLFVTAMLYYSFKWYNNAAVSKVKPAYFLLLGVAFSHHQTVILILPALLLLYLFKKQQFEHSTPFDILKRWVNYPFDRKFNKSFPYIFCFFLAIAPFFLALWFIAQRYPFINWGEISTPVGLLRALIRADYGSIGAYLTNVKNSTVAVDQIPFFAQHLLSDFSLYTLVIAIIGLVVLYKNSKRTWVIVVTLFLISGPLFIMYANFSLEGDFSKATVARFYMLPEIALIFFMYAALSKLANIVINIDKLSPGNEIYRKIGTFLLIGSLSVLILQEYYQNKPSFDNLTYSFAKTAIENTEDNAMILVTGDIPNMTIQYVEAVENEKKNRVIFSPGQFHLKWFQKQLRQRYPSLKIPEPLPGKQFTSPSQVIDANFGKQPIYIVTDFVDIDPEIQKKYVLWPKFLLLKVEKPGVEYKLEPYLEENNKLYESLNLREFETLRNKKYQLESPLVFYYSRHFYNLGAVFNSIHRYDDAIKQFERALVIDPLMSDAYKALGSIYYFTDDFPDKNPDLALQYLYRYLQTTKGQSVDQIVAVQDAINKINNDLKKEQEELLKKRPAPSSTIQATSSAESSQAVQVNQTK